MFDKSDLIFLKRRFLISIFYNICFIILFLICFSCFNQKAEGISNEQLIKQSQVSNFKIQSNANIKQLTNPKKKDIPIKTHSGGKQLNHNELLKTVKIVISSINNLKNINSNHLCDLVLETMIVETLVGKSRYEYASKNYRNHGIAQIREDTARWLLDSLKKKDIKTYNDIIKYFNNKKSLKHNLLNNVPFSIAICAEYYYNRNKNLKNEIKSVNARAYQWKKFYNTPKGKGTPQIYKNRVRQYYAQHILN